MNIYGYQTEFKPDGSIAVRRYRRTLREMILLRQTRVLDHRAINSNRCVWRNEHQKTMMSRYSMMLSSVMKKRKHKIT